MRKHTTILLLFLTVFNTLGQEKRGSREKIKALKVAFLTQELTLTSTEAEKFWPLYNKHQKKLNDLRRQRRVGLKTNSKKVKNLDTLDETTAKNRILFNLSLERKTLEEKENFIPKIATVLSYQKIMKLQLSEREFTKKLMRSYRARKNEKKRND